MENANNTANFLKIGNSYGIKLTENDCKLLNLELGDELEKVISPDHTSITFKKKQSVDDETIKLIDELFDENKELMELLKDK